MNLIKTTRQYLIATPPVYPENAHFRLHQRKTRTTIHVALKSVKNLSTSVYRTFSAFIAPYLFFRGKRTLMRSIFKMDLWAKGQSLIRLLFPINWRTKTELREIKKIDRLVIKGCFKCSKLLGSANTRKYYALPCFHKNKNTFISFDSNFNIWLFFLGSDLTVELRYVPEDIELDVW